MRRSILTCSAEQTRSFGRRLGRLVGSGTIVGLCGDVGAGKTCLVKGIAAGLEVAPESVTSPTFTLVAEHYTGRLPLFHLDLYRLEGANIEELGYGDYLFGPGVAVIEWFQYLPIDLIEEYLSISFECEAGDRRRLLLSPHGEAYEELVTRLFAKIEASQVNIDCSK